MQIELNEIDWSNLDEFWGEQYKEDYVGKEYK